MTKENRSWNCFSRKCTDWFSVKSSWSLWHVIQGLLLSTPSNYLGMLCAGGCSQFPSLRYNSMLQQIHSRQEWNDMKNRRSFSTPSCTQLLLQCTEIVFCGCEDRNFTLSSPPALRWGNCIHGSSWSIWRYVEHSMEKSISRVSCTNHSGE